MAEEEFSWRGNGVLSDPFHQNRCGCCSIIAPLRACTSFLAIQNLNQGQPIQRPHFAPQYVINNIHRRRPFQCHTQGATGTTAVGSHIVFHYLRQYRVPLVEDYEPYATMRTSDRVQKRPGRPTLTVPDYSIVETYEEEHKHDLLRHPNFRISDVGGDNTILEAIRRQPIVGDFDCSDAYMWYVDQIYRGREDDLDKKTLEYHSVLLTGYGHTDDEVVFFEVLNSAGDQVRDGGYFKVLRSLFH